MKVIAKVLVVLSVVAAVSACAMKGPCAEPRAEGMMKQYGGK